MFGLVPSTLEVGDRKRSIKDQGYRILALTNWSDLRLFR